MISENVRIGTSGFAYKDWLGNFYPQFLPSADFLQFYASKFHTVEIDSTYYRIPSVSMVDRWAKVTPDGFLFTAKFPRVVTHEGDIDSRLKNAAGFIEIMSRLGTKLGPLLLQFPYSFKPEEERTLIRLIESLPAGRRFAVELRNKSWLDCAHVFDLLKNRNIAFCLIDHPCMPRVDFLTADFAYFRFLGDRTKIECDFSYARCSKEADLEPWAAVIERYSQQGITSFAYFNNHYSGHAPTTAETLKTLLSK
jgi:uncharacterized protein YecE (DUF72 family)